jgi:hypothetical protein
MEWFLPFDRMLVSEGMVFAICLDAGVRWNAAIERDANIWIISISVKAAVQLLLSITKPKFS